jgi:transcription termination/antitermination protein NusA
MAAENVFSDLNRMIEQIGKDKGIDKTVIVDAVVQAMLTAARKKYGTYRQIEAQYNEDTGEVELIEFKEVIADEEFQDEEVEIKLSEAHAMDPNAQLGDFIGSNLDSRDLGRIAAQTAKQIITQRVRDAEREIIYNEFEQRKGEIASGIARRVERGAIVVDLGRTEAYLPLREQIPGEVYKPGDRIQGYLIDVRQTTRGPQIIMSRSDERYLVKLFEMEVPEIHDGIVEVKAAAREPGSRAKIAVVSKDSSVDPVGACVGMKGSRVQNIVQELRGEKIDIINWDEDITSFACNALAPAEVAKVFIDENSREMEIVVPDHQLSLAIGKKGQNVRLAAKLTGWKIDILSETNLNARNAEAVLSLMNLPGMTDTMAQNIYQSGFKSFDELASIDVEDAKSIPGFEDEAKASKLIQDAKELVAKYKAEGKPLRPLLTLDQKGGSTGSAKSLADLRLKQELAQLNQQPAAADAATPAETPASDATTNAETSESVKENE